MYYYPQLNTKTEKKMSHAKLSPSSAFRWLNCPGSIRLSAGIKDTSSPAAEEGTRAHELAEKMLAGKKGKADSDEMLAYVQQYVDYVREIAGDNKVYIEQRVDLTEYVPNGYGTADVITITGDTLHVIDLKYGLSRVFPKDNPQLYLYALGAYTGLKKKKRKAVKAVLVHIIQPRCDSWLHHEIPVDELLAWGEEIKPKAEMCLTDDAELNPSEGACRWCPAAPTCPALHKQALEVVGGDFEVLPVIEDMDAPQMITALRFKPLIIEWLTKLEAHLEHELTSGHEIEGLKLVEGRSMRKYTDNAEKVLAKRLGDSAFLYTKKLITLTAAEKLVGKQEFQDLDITFKPDGKPKVVPDTDSRLAITKTADDFISH